MEDVRSVTTEGRTGGAFQCSYYAAVCVACVKAAGAALCSGAPGVERMQARMTRERGGAEEAARRAAVRARARAIRANAAFASVG